MGGFIITPSNLVIIAGLFQLVYTGYIPRQELCEVFPKNPVVLYGSDLMVLFKAPLSGHCRRWTRFNPSSVYWTLNNKRIDQKFYYSNSTFSSVSIHNLSVEKGTVECLLDNFVLGGTIIRTYLPLISPQNVSCIGREYFSNGYAIVNCTWDHDQIAVDLKYKICLKYTYENNYEVKCESEKKTLTAKMYPSKPLSITVSVMNPSGGEDHSSEVNYSTAFSIIKKDPLVNVQITPELNVLRVTWMCDNWLGGVEYEVCLHEKDLLTKPVVRCLKSFSKCSFEFTGLKPCTKYSASVRRRYANSFWSEWSQEVTALSKVSTGEFYLWRTQSVIGDEGKRTVHLMWKGISPSCKPFDQYCVYDHAHKSNMVTSRCSKPFQNHTFITLDEYAHKITVAAFHINTSHNEASIEVPAKAEDVGLPPVSNVSVLVQHGQIHVMWQKPSLPVSGYLIVWNNTGTNHMWNYIQESSFSIKGEPLTLYTVALTPVYENGPGGETRFHQCTSEGSLPTMSIFITEVSDRKAVVRWSLDSHTLCYPHIVNYTVCYKASSEIESKNITVEPNQQMVILDNLQPSTAYDVQMVLSSLAASSTSASFTFSTNLSKVFLTVLIACGVGVALLPLFGILTLMMRRKYLGVNIPNPQLSSVSLWPSGNCKKPFLPFPWGSDFETVLPCQVDSEIIRVSPTSNGDVAKLKAQANGLKITTPEGTGNAALAANSANNKQLPIVGIDQPIQPLPTVNFQTQSSYVLSITESPYRKQTPLNSPVESPTTLQFSDETEMLLKPKVRNTTFFSCYVTVDKVEPGMGHSKIWMTVTSVSLVFGCLVRVSPSMKLTVTRVNLPSLFGTKRLCCLRSQYKFVFLFHKNSLYVFPVSVCFLLQSKDMHLVGDMHIHPRRMGPFLSLSLPEVSFL